MFKKSTDQKPKRLWSFLIDNVDKKETFEDIIKALPGILGGARIKVIGTIWNADKEIGVALIKWTVPGQPDRIIDITTIRKEAKEKWKLVEKAMNDNMRASAHISYNMFYKPRSRGLAEVKEIPFFIKAVVEGKKTSKIPEKQERRKYYYRIIGDNYDKKKDFADAINALAKTIGEKVEEMKPFYNEEEGIGRVIAIDKRTNKPDVFIDMICLRKKSKLKEPIDIRRDIFKDAKKIYRMHPYIQRAGKTPATFIIEARKKYEKL